MKYLFGAVCSVSLLFILASPCLAQQAPPVLPLSKAIPLPVADISLAEMAKQWPVFQHAPIDTAGYSHLTLPFRYEDVSGDGDPSEAYALSFLISNDLDWGNGNYCARHAYFVFKRDREAMQPLANEYKSESIAKLMDFWDATVAVGGLLRHHADGFSGVLELYNTKGELTKKVIYDQPRDYYQLLGDMSVNALTVLDGKPNDAMVEHLHHARSKHHESIIDLGKAAFAPERSDEEFGLYLKILQRDPSFADVRYWWAGQSFWADGGRDRQKYRRRKISSLHSYMVASVLPGFHEHIDQTDFDEFRTQTARITGPLNPTLIRFELNQANYQKTPVPEVIQRGIVAAGKNPNELWLLDALARALARGNGWPVDFDMSIGLDVAALRNNYSAAVTTDRYTVAGVLAKTFLMQGQPHYGAKLVIPPANRLLSKNRFSTAAYYCYRSATMLDRMCQFDQAVNYYRWAFKGYKEWTPSHARMLVCGGIAAAHDGRADILDQIIHDRSKIAKRAGMLDVLEAYLGLLEGKTDHPFFEKTWADHDTYWGYRAQTILLHEGALMRGTTKFRYRMNHDAAYRLDDRHIWILFDAYERMAPEENCASFYIALQWLHGDDPWVQQAAADFRRRSPDAKPLSTEEVAEWLKAFEPEATPVKDPDNYDWAMKVLLRMPPFSVAAAIKPLIENGQFDKAEELALRFRHLAADYDSIVVTAHAVHLLHRIDQARKAAASAKASLAEDRPGDDGRTAAPEGHAGQNVQKQATGQG